jgi:DNA-directed RNA polymerase specialized sigma24 family protein
VQVIQLDGADDAVMAALDESMLAAGQWENPLDDVIDLRRLLQRLPPRRQSVFCRLFSGYTQKEIAADIGRSARTIAS